MKKRNDYKLSDAQMECRLFIPGNKILVPADGDKIASVFENLLSNAIKYGAGGKLVDFMLQKQTRTFKLT